MTTTRTGGWTQADVYAEVFGPICAAPVGDLLDGLGSSDRADATPPSLLDVGTGPGTVAAHAAARGWTATGVDPSPEMLELARRASPSASLAIGGVPDLPFDDDAFDLSAANFVINHVPDPRAGVRDMLRVTRPGGRIGISIWPSNVNELNLLWLEVLERADVTVPVGHRLPPHLDFERTEAGVHRLLGEVGGLHVTTRTVEWSASVAADALQRAMRAGIATIGVSYANTDAAGRSRLNAAWAEVIEERATNGAAQEPTSGSRLDLRFGAVLAWADMPVHA